MSLALGFSGNNVTFWRTKKAWPSDEKMLKLAELAGIPRREGLVELAIWRTGGTEAAPIYMKILKQISTSMIAFLFFGGIPSAFACGLEAVAQSTICRCMYIFNAGKKIWFVNAVLLCNFKSLY